MYILRDPGYLCIMKWYTEWFEGCFWSQSGSSVSDKEKDSYQTAMLEIYVFGSRLIMGRAGRKKDNVLFWANENRLELFTVMRNISW